jgi:hypothetical protein
VGQISEKLKKQLKRIKASYRSMPVADLRPFTQPDKGRTDPVKTLDQLQDYHPIHAVYLATQNLVSYLSEELSGLPAMHDFSHLVGQAEDEYWPQGPPMSPLTVSYFTTWAFFDAVFGPDRETVGSCLLDIGPELGLPADYLNAIRLMQQSRMGIYEHRGVQDELVRLQELISGRSHTCRVPAGYLGQARELWYVRILPSPIAGLEESLVFTTPYKLVAPGKREWLDFLRRTMPQTGLPTSQPSLTQAGVSDGNPALEGLMKYGLAPYYWHEFILQAYLNHRHDVIFLTGLPDVPESLPHSARGG